MRCAGASPDRRRHRLTTRCERRQRSARARARATPARRGLERARVRVVALQRAARLAVGVDEIDRLRAVPGNRAVACQSSYCCRERRPARRDRAVAGPPAEPCRRGTISRSKSSANSRARRSSDVAQSIALRLAHLAEPAVLQRRERATSTTSDDRHEQAERQRRRRMTTSLARRFHDASRWKSLIRKVLRS